MNTLPQNFLGNTPLKVTRLGYGSMGLRGANTWGVRVVEDAAAERFLNRVLDAGVNFIDTSPDYGQSEQRIGQFISSRRREYYLATKCGCDYVQHSDYLEIRHTWNRDVVQRNLEASLRRMRTDYLDLLQFHGGDAKSLIENGLIELLEEFKQAGKIRHIGVSSKLPELENLLQLDVFDTVQLPYSCVAPEHARVIGQAAKAGVGIIVRGGIAQGGPEAAIQRDAVNHVWRTAKLDELLPEATSPAQLLLRYTLSNPDVHTAIVGTCDPVHFDENLTAVQSGPLPAELIQEIDRRVCDCLMTK